MKTIGALVVCFSLGMRIGQNFSIEQFDYAFVLSGIGIAFIIRDNIRTSKGIPKMKNPPPPPKKCICSDIGKHSPGGRCEADHSNRKYSFGLPEID